MLELETPFDVPAAAPAGDVPRQPVSQPLARHNRLTVRLYAVMAAVAFTTFGTLAASYEMYSAASRPFA